MLTGREDLWGSLGPADPAACYVALDLETTGLSSERDAIIEVGAVKFREDRVLDVYQSLVNPYRKLPEFIRRLTGIRQHEVDRAPSFAVVAGEFREFVGGLPVVGHNVAFDLGFLSRNGLTFPGEAYDTWDLAAVLLPSTASYSLPKLAAQLSADHERAHRALDDAQATRLVFLTLLSRARALSPGTAASIQRVAGRARWPVARLFAPSSHALVPAPSTAGVDGLDVGALEARLARSDPSLRPVQPMTPVDVGEMETHMGPGGPLSRALPGFERRPQQVEMMKAVAEAFNSGGHLMVEAGTGVGKSLAYLMPAVLHSVKNGSRVVVSTNTINLQEQLLNKDIPALRQALEDDGIISPGELRVAPLKGRANYLCLRRWGLLARGEDPTTEDARLLAKTLVWLQDTRTGDRGEMNLSVRDAPAWGRVSAADKGSCPSTRGEGLCFLRAARDRAEAAHVVVVNHALLLSDLAMGGSVLPGYDHLIVDEAHHLEEEATRQMGFQISQGRLADETDAVGKLVGGVVALARGSGLPQGQARSGQEAADRLQAHWSRQVRDRWDRLWSMADGFLAQHQADQGPMSVTRSTRAQPGWSDLEVAWENLDVVLDEAVRHVDRVASFLDSLPAGGPADVESMSAEAANWQGGLEELRERLKTFLAAPADAQRIDWMERVSQSGGDSEGRYDIVLHSAPLNVGNDLDEQLFSKKRSVVLTSATLASQGSLDYMRDRVGLKESEELMVGSPFDYRRAAVILVPKDIPAPTNPGFQQAADRLVVELARELKGHTLVLFTSHAALRATARGVRPRLEAEGIRVLAQGVDGSPRQIVQEFSESPSSVILGTSSLWEGVDLAGGVLKALVIGRLPFHVPTDPIFAARSDQYEDPFQQYALPQAVLRLRQGVGRLIRGSGDRGAIVVLDSRIVSRAYGRAFLESMPDCIVRQTPTSAVAHLAGRWVRREAAASPSMGGGRGEGA